MAYIRLIFRSIWFVGGSFIGAITMLLFRLLRFPFSWNYAVFTFWQRCMTWGLNIKIEQEGSAPIEPGIIMANHRSYIDVLMIQSRTPLVFVAKSSVKSWPIIGWGGDGLHTVWVDRSSKESRKKTRAQLAARLKSGESVVVFPEGTTHKGPESLEFKPGMFFAVAKEGLPVYPLAIEYQDQDVAWIDDDLFLPHFAQTFKKPVIRVKACYGGAIVNSDGEQLRLYTHSWINQRLISTRKQWD